MGDGMTHTTVVTTEVAEPGIVVVTLNRPDRLNALNGELVTALHRVFEELDAAQSVRVVILTGAGRGFCAGADIKGGPDAREMSEPIEPGTIPLTLQVQEHLASLHERIHRLRKPVIAAVNGVAVGGGFSLTLACDIRIAAESARFGAVFIKLGISACDMGVSYFLPRLVGAARSAELLLTGRVFDAAEAQAMDLVLDVVPDDRLLDRALETARAIAANEPLAVWMTKETMWQTIDAPSLRAALDMENRTQVLCTATGAMQRATQRFREGTATSDQPANRTGDDGTSR
jgi:enoyl-CoA hydratase